MRSKGYLLITIPRAKFSSSLEDGTNVAHIDREHLHCAARELVKKRKANLVCVTTL
jgi:hypothetical protein